DGRMTAVFSRGARLIGEVLFEHTRDLAIDAIGGMEVGAVPLTTAAGIAYDLHGPPLGGFLVRDQAKGHGTREAVEGGPRAGMRVAVVDDVVTRGGSTVKAVTAARDAGATVVCVLALVDRLQGAAALFREHGIPDYRPVFTVRDLGVESTPDTTG